MGGGIRGEGELGSKPRGPHNFLTLPSSKFEAEKWVNIRLGRWGWFKGFLQVGTSSDFQSYPRSLIGQLSQGFKIGPLEGLLSPKSDFFIFFKGFIYLFLERRDKREKERERNINVWMPLVCPLQGTWPTTQACALTGNGTSNPLVHRLALSPLSHTSQGPNLTSSKEPVYIGQRDLDWTKGSVLYLFVQPQNL